MGARPPRNGGATPLPRGASSGKYPAGIFPHLELDVGGFPTRRRHGYVTGNFQKLETKTCAVEGCLLPAAVRGNCSRHDAKLRYSGSVYGPPKCSVDGCGRFAKVEGLCRRHLDQRDRPAPVPRSPSIRTPRPSTGGCGPKRRDFSGLTVGEVTVHSANADGTWACSCSCGAEFSRGHAKLNASFGGGTHSTCGVQGRACVGKVPRAGMDDASIREGIVRRTRNGYMTGARVRGLAFELELEDFARLIFSACSYCGDAADKAHHGVHFGGIDRVDNDFGYTVGNSAPCCAMCNRAKSVMTVPQWSTWLARITAFQTAIR